MKPLIVANWKMNPTSQKEAKQIFDAIKKGIKSAKNVEVVICPPFVYLANTQYLTPNIKIGAQNCLWEEKGAYTGEISAIMLKNLGIEYVIIGHSERRKYFKETDEEINKKIKEAVGVGLKVILCVGESAEEWKQGKKSQVLKSQLKNDLNKITRDEIKNIAIAYEPVWAIGTGNNCSVDETMKSILFIRQTLTNLYNREVADKTRILYGGSVNGDNSRLYIKEALANGLLVGGASLKADEFIKIVVSLHI